ncbi:hypothetical protein ACFL0I_02650, partial [Gemmatimonadota bacterium]
MRTSRFLLLTGAALLSGATASCAAGPGPDLNGPQGPSLMAAYSGDWVLVRTESDDLAEKIREAQNTRGMITPGTGSAGAGRSGGRGRGGGGMP